MPSNLTIQARRDTAANWVSTNPVLAAAEYGVETDTLLLKIGDGTSAWSALPYAQDPTGFAPASGAYTMPGNVLSVAAGTPVTAAAVFYPLDVGPPGWTPQQVCCNLTTQQVGGTGTLVKIALYADRGDGGGPLLTSAGLLFQATVDATSGGGAVGVRSAAYTTRLKQGRYWTCFFYYQGTAAPTTVPQFTCCSNAVSLSAASTQAFQVTRCLIVSGLTDLPTAGQAVLGSGAATAPVVSVRRA